MRKGKFLDLVIAGPDMSGTSTQIKNIIEYFQNEEMVVRDLRGTEIDVLFHSDVFQNELGLKRIEDKFLNFQNYISKINEWKKAGVTTLDYLGILGYMNKLLSGGGTNQDLCVASMIKNKVTTYINPNSAEVWIMEEPSKRSAGQVNRVIEQNRSKFGDKMNPKAAAETHSVYRSDEFYRFRKPLRESGKMIIRSRSEESGCYQIYDENFLKNGVNLDYYMQLEGHKIAFANPPTDIFVVCGPENWKEKDYLKLKEERNDGRNLDDHEKDAGYQVLVNKRYATNWLEKFYERETKKYGSISPEITRFSIYDSKEEIKYKMGKKLETLI